MEGNVVARTWVIRGLLAFAIIVGALALWTIVPVAWLYLTGDLVDNGGARFVLVIFGCPLTMALVFVALHRVESYRRALSPVSEPKPLLERMLVASAVIAVAGLILWWFFVADAADPSGPLQPL
jgi:hypothetical protein